MAALATGFGAGHNIAKTAGEVKVAAVKADMHTAELAYERERQGWIADRAKMNADSLAALTKAHQEAADKEAAIRVGFSNAEKQYRKKIKELENAKSEAERRIVDNSPTGGLWVSVEGASCSGDTAGGQSRGKADMSPPTGSTVGSPGALQCRLAQPLAQALVQIVSEADHRTELLNKCIGVLGAQQQGLMGDPRQDANQPKE